MHWILPIPGESFSGDIKPSNIMVISPDWQSDYAKLFDFGIARVLNDRCVI